MNLYKHYLEKVARLAYNPQARAERLTSRYMSNQDDMRKATRSRFAKRVATYRADANRQAHMKDPIKKLNDSLRPAADSLRASNDKTKKVINSTNKFIGRSQAVNSAVKGAAVVGGSALGAYGIYRALKKPKPPTTPPTTEKTTQ